MSKWIDQLLRSRISAAQMKCLGSLCRFANHVRAGDAPSRRKDFFESLREREIRWEACFTAPGVWTVLLVTVRAGVTGGTTARCHFPTLWVRKAHVRRPAEEQGGEGRRHVSLPLKNAIHLGRTEKIKARDQPPGFRCEMPAAFAREFPSQRDVSVHLPTHLGCRPPDC